jgi:hypothetical protein
VRIIELFIGSKARQARTPGIGCYCICHGAILQKFKRVAIADGCVFQSGQGQLARFTTHDSRS